MIRTLLIVLLASLLAACSPSGPEGSVTVEVSAGSLDRDSSVVVIEAPAEWQDETLFALVRADSAAAVPVQKLTGEPARVAFILDEPLAAGQKRNYYLSPASPAAVEPAVTAVDSRRPGVTMSVGGKPVLLYNKAVIQPPEGADPLYAASGYIHPLYSPSGKILTDGFPPDHYHQHGVYFAWVKATFEGREVDFWNQAKGFGGTEHFTLKDVRSGDVFSELTVVRMYMDTTDADKPKRAVEETWVIRVYNLADPFLIDIESEQRAASPSPLIVEEYHYGGFAIRGAREWFDEPASNFLTSEGKDEKEGNHTRPNWVEVHGPVDGSHAGAVLMGAPSNFRHPQPVRLHPSKPYFCFAPMVDGTFQIKADELYRSAYRIATHDGEPDAEMNNRLWADYSEPVTATVVR
jgi:methane monooxygenase PmoA-like